MLTINFNKNNLKNFFLIDFSTTIITILNLIILLSNLLYLKKPHTKNPLIFYYSIFNSYPHFFPFPIILPLLGVPPFGVPTPPGGGGGGGPPTPGGPPLPLLAPPGGVKLPPRLAATD